MPVDPSTPENPVILPVLNACPEPQAKELEGSDQREPKDLALNEPKDLKESHLRSLLKAMSWRILATLTTVLIAYFITGEIDIAIMIGSIEFVLKFLIYYLHERAWQLVPRGSIRQLVSTRSS